MYELLDAAGATLCDPLLIILLAVMVLPSGGTSSAYSFSGSAADVPFLLIQARAAARRLPCQYHRTGNAGWNGAPIFQGPPPGGVAR